MPPKRATDSWMWAVVLSATGLVVALAIVKGRTGVSSLEGKPAPAVTLQLLEGGKQLSLASHKGRVVMLDFWATWCAPCRQSMPQVERVFRDYAGRGVDLYAVNTDRATPDREPAVREFLMQNGLKVDVAVDGDRQEAQNAFGVSSLPTLVVLDRAGNVALTHVGTLNAGTERALRSALDAALSARHVN